MRGIKTCINGVFKFNLNKSHKTMYGLYVGRVLRTVYSTDERWA